MVFQENDKQFAHCVFSPPVNFRYFFCSLGGGETCDLECGAFEHELTMNGKIYVGTEKHALLSEPASLFTANTYL